MGWLWWLVRLKAVAVVGVAAAAAEKVEAEEVVVDDESVEVEIKLMGASLKLKGFCSLFFMGLEPAESDSL